MGQLDLSHAREAVLYASGDAMLNHPRCCRTLDGPMRGWIYGSHGSRYRWTEVLYSRKHKYHQGYLFNWFTYRI